MNTLNRTIQALRRELRASMDDRSKLSKLHATVTDSINQAYGEEKELLVKFRQEVKDALNCRTLDPWGKR
jgi:nitrate/nitrite-specific signal transduction histidine kinase